MKHRFSLFYLVWRVTFRNIKFKFSTIITCGFKLKWNENIGRMGRGRRHSNKNKVQRRHLPEMYFSCHCEILEVLTYLQVSISFIKTKFSDNGRNGVANSVEFYPHYLFFVCFLIKYTFKNCLNLVGI